MKKFLRTIATVFAVLLLSITFTACAGDGNLGNINERDNYVVETNYNTHSANINNEVLFYHYSTTADTTSSTSDATITISPSRRYKVKKILSILLCIGMVCFVGYNSIDNKK